MVKMQKRKKKRKEERKKQIEKMYICVDFSSSCEIGELGGVRSVDFLLIRQNFSCC
jgi:hypothetical protein